MGAGLARGAREGLAPLLPEPWYAFLRARRDGAPWARSPMRAEFAREQRVEARAAERGYRIAGRPDINSRSARARVVAVAAFAHDLRVGEGARFGVDLRDPTADVRVFDFCLSLPEEQYQCRGQRRRLVRRAMARRLPAEILDNPRRGPQAADWFERLAGAQPALLEALAEAERSDTARRARPAAAAAAH